MAHVIVNRSLVPKCQFLYSYPENINPRPKYHYLDVKHLTFHFSSLVPQARTITIHQFVSHKYDPSPYKLPFIPV